MAFCIIGNPLDCSEEMWFYFSFRLYISTIPPNLNEAKITKKQTQEKVISTDNDDFVSINGVKKFCSFKKRTDSVSTTKPTQPFLPQPWSTHRPLHINYAISLVQNLWTVHITIIHVHCDRVSLPLSHKNFHHLIGNAWQVLITFQCCAVRFQHCLPEVLQSSFHQWLL